MSKKGILVVSFGTSYEDARTSCIDPVEALIADRHPQFDVRRAFTSRRIIKKLKDRDAIHIDNEIEGIEKMIEEGMEEIYLQPLHIMPGYEYEKIESAVVRARHKFNGKITLGEPLIFCEEDYSKVLEALDVELNALGKEEALTNWLLMGHGTHHPANATYSCMQLHFEMAGKPISIASLESFPNLDHTVPQLRKKGISKMGVMPFMLVAGDHAQNDMAGPDEDSWVNRLTADGFDVTPKVVGLGALKSFQILFADKVSKLVQAENDNEV